MKRMVCCIIIVAALTAFSAYSYFYCEKVSQDISGMLTEISASFEQEDYEKAAQYAKTACDKWNLLSENTVFVEDTECDNEIKMSLARIMEMVAGKSDDLHAECAVAKIMLHTFTARQRPIFVNIF